MNRVGEFIYTESKPLPVILLLDTSKSMTKNNNIGTLNNAVNEMIKSLKTSSCNEASIQIAVITFGEETGILFPLQDIKNINMSFELKARGGTFMAKAIDTAKEMIEDKEVIPSRSYRPIVIMVTDGAPGDNWRIAMSKFIHDGRNSKCFRMAMGIGNGAEGISREVLETFVSGKDYLFSAKNAAEISSFFQYATMSVQRSIPRATVHDQKIEQVNKADEELETISEDVYLEDLMLF